MSESQDMVNEALRVLEHIGGLPTFSVKAIGKAIKGDGRLVLMVTCPSCKGVKKVWNPGAKGNVSICTHCDGTGEVEDWLATFTYHYL